jgi:hypothetical protein
VPDYTAITDKNDDKYPIETGQGSILKYSETQLRKF